MSVLIENESKPATNGVESMFAEVLADVLRVDRVSVDSHFFDELGADSLVMAHFCARVRKRGNLPSVSMKDVYAHPTIRDLAAAALDLAPATAAPRATAALELPTPTNAREYVLCGALQALFTSAIRTSASLPPLRASSGWWRIRGCGKLPAVGPVRRRCLLRRVRRSDRGEVADHRSLETQSIRIWSLAYVRFWIVKSLIRRTPSATCSSARPCTVSICERSARRSGPAS